MRYMEGKFNMNNLADILIQNYNKIPNKICLIEDNKKIDFAELYNKVCSFKEYLISKGIKKNYKVLILVPMSIELYVTLLSIWSIGAIPCFMDAGFIKSSIKNNSFEDIDAVIGISKYIVYSNINKNLRKINLKINSSVINKLKYNENVLQNVALEKEFPAILTYTSGTTGKPKIAARSHEFLNIQGKILADIMKYEKEDIEISTIPIFTLSNINFGITTVIAKTNFSNLGKTNPFTLINQINKNNVNRIMLSPGVLSIITDYCIKRNVKFSNIKKVFSGGGAIFLDLIKNVQAVFKNSNMYTLYGSTEAEPIAILNVNEITENDIKKINLGYGILAGNIVGVDKCYLINTDKEKLGILNNDEFEKIKTADVGEIVVSGENVLKGYVNGIGDEKNKFNVEEVKFHRTGDLGRFDENGRLWLQGRIKEPFFNIEAYLHANYRIGKTAVFKNNDEIILVLEKKDKADLTGINRKIKFTKIDKVVYVKKIPVDKRHSTKVDYTLLRRMLKI